MKFKYPTDLKYNGVGYNAKNIRQFKDGTKKTEADFVKQVAGKLTEVQAKELYAIANTPETSGDAKVAPTKK